MSLTRRLVRAALPALSLFAASFFPAQAQAQAPKIYSSSEILLGLKKLNVLGSVLYLAAHPDDENTRLIAYMANGRLVETGYFSCTRGDGGQNLIGPELREQLGVIRTQELLAARRIDGGRQFFSRANDFGFSKTSDETFKIWDKEQVLADMVWVIRQRRPDVLITRFPPDARAGHGHHQASAILAAEAFDAAGDPKRFPEQLKYVQPWSPKRLLWNTGSFFVKPGESMEGYLKLDAGGYNALLGQSYGEIAARSRSQHRSQGFGSAAQRGEALEYLQLVKGEKATKDPLDGVDLSWNRVKGGAAVGKLIDEVIRKYDASKPEASVPALLKVRAVLAKLSQNVGENSLPTTESFWAREKQQELEQLCQAALGLSVEALAPAPLLGAREQTRLRVEVLNRSSMPVKVTDVSFDGTTPGLAKDTTWTQTLLPGKLLTLRPAFSIPDCGPNSQPYWLQQRSQGAGMYELPYAVSLNRWVRPGDNLDAPHSLIGAQELVFLTNLTSPDGTKAYQAGTHDLLGRPENPTLAVASVAVQVGETPPLLISVPVQFKRVDPAVGEIYQPLVVLPPILVNLPGARAYVFADQQPKTVPVTVRAGQANASGSVSLSVPAGWKVSPAATEFKLATKNEEKTLYFQVQPGPEVAPGQAELRAVVSYSGYFCVPGPEGPRKLTRGIQQINYPHIPTQTLFPEAVAPLVRLDVKRRKEEIGYLMGAGDEVPDALRQLGYRVTLLKPEELSADKLKRFDAVVLGVRAYNTVDRLKYQQKELLEYVEKGGTLVVQYTVNRGTVLPEIGPYPMQLSNDRVTVEDAPVTITRPQHQLMSLPNKITAKDFEGWQQEQGLYYPSSWDPKYQTVISSQDPGEKPKESAILVTDYGKGHYIYTGLSFFRELPAGVPGAYRLITNMIELGKDKAN
ncbi:PIG-L family deacetylase [Hymenobacter sp. 15J16-1T3B]|uniref:PIG-L family deacetylase n=1 Tax=Hymenobacter sp. 15J16-1T3B TaxID=2886941 RepID=UPI001D11154E|nr:PIG-L family deacetylase [Hymenobacter sp. 15J16-1T3B]MCC3158357.1 PIG-L family deacetylase [Hymenobacter sp. 15J16-1T3B]